MEEVFCRQQIQKRTRFPACLDVCGNEAAQFQKASSLREPSDELLTAPGLIGSCGDAQSLQCFSFLLVSLCLQISSTVI